VNYHHRISYVFMKSSLNKYCKITASSGLDSCTRFYMQMGAALKCHFISSVLHMQQWMFRKATPLNYIISCFGFRIIATLCENTLLFSMHDVGAIQKDIVSQE
jgi:hypothetical protein